MDTRVQEVIDVLDGNIKARVIEILQETLGEYLGEYLANQGVGYTKRELQKNPTLGAYRTFHSVKDLSVRLNHQDARIRAILNALVEQGLAEKKLTTRGFPPHYIYRLKS